MINRDPSQKSRLARHWARLGVAVLALVNVSVRGLDLVRVEVFKSQQSTQSTATAVAPLGAAPYLFHALAQPLLPSWVTSPAIRTPAGASHSLTLDSTNDFVFEDSAASLTALASSYGSGTYLLSYHGQNDGAGSVSVTLGADNYPPVPHIANFDAAQSITNSQDFTLNLAAWTAAGASDFLQLVILDAKSNLVFETAPLYSPQALSATNTSLSIPSNTLGVSNSYVATLTYGRLTTRQLSGIPLTVGGFLSATRFPLRSQASGSGGTTPPVLTQSFPTNGTTLSNASLTLPVAFSFSQPMTPTQSIQWSPNLDPTQFSYQWQPDGTGLACAYAGGFPANATFTWTLNPTASDPNNFRDLSGNLLAINTYHGQFFTAGTNLTSHCMGADLLTAASFAVFKTIYYLQTSAGAPTPAANPGAALSGFVIVPAGTFATAGFVRPPNLGGALDAFQQTTLGYLNFTDDRSTQAALDAAFIPGSYQVVVWTPTATNQTMVSLASASYPPTPHFANYAVAQTVDSTADFTVSWDPFSTAGTNDLASLVIRDASGQLVWQTPDACNYRTLAATASSAVIPAGTLSPGTYQVALKFTQVTDQGETLFPQAPMFTGVAGLAQVTTMTLRTLGSSPAAPPSVAIISPTNGAALPAGNVNVNVQADQTNGVVTGIAVYAGNNLLASTNGVNQAHYAGNLPILLASGNYQLTAVAANDAGLSSTSAVVSITVTNVAALQVALTNPADGATLPPGAPLTLAAQVGGGVAPLQKVEYFNGATKLGASASSPYVLTLTNPTPGIYLLTARVTDALGNTAVAPWANATVAGTASLKLMAPLLTTNGYFKVSAAGTLPAALYVLETTSNLKPPISWAAVLTNQASDVTADLVDVRTPPGAANFYRVRLLGAAPKPLQAQALLDTNYLSVLGDTSEAGQFGLTNQAGVVFSLAVPAEDLDLDAAVTLTAVTNLAGLAVPAPVLAAAQVAPTDLNVAASPSLSIQFPTAPTNTPLAAFSLSAETGEFRLIPFQLTNTTATLPVFHFGTLGLAVLSSNDLAVVRAHPPADPMDQLVQLAALIELGQPGFAPSTNVRTKDASAAFAHSRSRPASSELRTRRQPSSGGGPSPDNSIIVSIYLEAFDAHVLPPLLAAESNGEVLAAALQGYYTYWDTLWGLGLLDQFSLQIDAANQLAIAAIAHRINELTPRCLEHDLDAIIRMGRVSRVMSVLPWGTAYPPGVEAQMRDKINKCLKFELDFESTTVLDSAVGQVTTAVATQIPFQYKDQDLVGKIKGTGTLAFTQRDHYDPAPCSVEVGTPTTDVSKMFQLLFRGFPPASTNDTFQVRDLRLIAYPGKVDEGFNIICPMAPPIHPVYWYPEFGVLHEDEFNGYRLNNQPPQLAFDFSSDWTIQGGGSATIAVKTYNGQKAYQGGTITENTKLTLLHTPEM